MVGMFTVSHPSGNTALEMLLIDMGNLDLQYTFVRPQSRVHFDLTSGIQSGPLSSRRGRYCSTGGNGRRCWPGLVLYHHGVDIGMYGAFVSTASGQGPSMEAG